MPSTLFSSRAIALSLLVALSACGTTRSSAAQPGQIDVEEHGNRIVVRASGAPGSSRDDAGLLAMARACEISRARGRSHMGVVDFLPETRSLRVETGSGGVQYHGGTDGRPVGATPAPGGSRTVTYGHATLNVVLMDRDTALDSDGMHDVMQIIEARSCMVLNPGR